MLGMQTDMGGSGGVVGVRDTQSAIGLPEAKNEPSQPRAAPQPGVGCLFKLVMYRQKKHYPEKHEVERGRST